MAEVNLPKGWCLSRISDIATKGEQRTPNASEEFIYVDIGSINRDLKIIQTPQKLLGDSAPSRARKVINSGDVLVSLTRPNLNAVALVPDELNEQIASTGFEVIKPLIVDGRYVFALTRSKHFIDAISGAVQGALYPAAKSSDVQGYEFPLPPLAEQKVIAEKLDTLLAQVDNTKARLERIPEILKRFRQSVLAAAVSGKLTEDNAFKKRHLSSLKIIGKLTGGKTPSKSNACFWENGNIPWVSPKDMKSDFIDGSIDHITEQALGEAGMRLLPENTLLMVTRSGILAHSFPVALTKVPVTINQDIKAFTADTGKVRVDFCLYLIKGLEQRILNECSKAGTTVPSVETKLLENLMFELPTLEEQTEIIRRVEELFAFADRIEQASQAALSRVNNLTQSILAKAFRGELTADWRAANPELISGENSAEALLAKIKTERAKLSQTKKGRGKSVEN